ncbi:MAG TPA: phospholipid carrier-dependent glycosyltransferase [Candidatus Binataceae bacterium]|nr:phospholipid carrier-dependent glycosyltransferase [Candidatus Binataceae bacterium]
MVSALDFRSGKATRRVALALALAGTFICITGAADPSSAGAVANGKLAGLFSGLFLLGLILYAMWRCAEPILNDPEAGLGSALLILLAIWIVKSAMLPLFPGFGPDIGSYQAWSARIASVGPALTYKRGFFIDYPPGYLYALWAAGVIVKLTGATGTSARAIVESPALIADLLLAATIFIYLRAIGYRAGAYLGMLLIALNPAMIFESVVWGQSDSVLTLVMLLSVLMLLQEEYELGWGLAALAVLIKPQALALLPALGLWTLLKSDWRRWWRAALALVAVTAVAIAPFQIGHPWSWIFSLYAATAAYYHETSVNAFNFIALVAGLRRSDLTPVLGIPAFYLGMGLLVPLYLFVAWVLWKRPSRRTLWYVSLLSIFGFFMFAPRMHERYLYPALAFVLPLAIAEPPMMVLFGVLTVTCLFNLAYVKHALETVVFLNGRDRLAMLASAVNLAAFALAVGYHAEPQCGAGRVRWRRGLEALWARLRPSGGRPPAAAAHDTAQAAQPPLPWIRIDTVIVLILLAAAASVRFWKLGRPPDIVFDEVHFVAQARHYLRAEPFLDPHPPLAKLVIALGILLFGDHPWSWRVGNATIGTALVGLTYLVGRRMFRSRLAATFAALCIACDGMFLVDSRVAVIDIVYVTLAALSYYFLFCFIDQRDAPVTRRRTLVWLGIALGLCVGSKLYIPAVTFILVMGFMLYVIWDESRRLKLPTPALRNKRLLGAAALVGAVSSFCYIAVFLPHFMLGWWGGIADLFHYYKEVMWYERSVTSATHPYAAPWWSWPLMLRPIAYWQDFPKTGKVATIWGGGNPVLWWGALAAIMVYLGRTFERPNLVRAFIVIGYVSYLVIWIPIERTMFLYHYMPAVYIAYLALGALLAEFWNGKAQMLEEVALMLTLFPSCLLGLGYTVGAFAFLALAVAYAAVLDRPLWPGRVVCVAFVGAALVAFIYFFPVWVAMPIERAGYYARMWLQGPGLRNWI